jgi:hypothetical protein
MSVVRAEEIASYTQKRKIDQSEFSFMSPASSSDELQSGLDTPMSSPNRRGSVGSPLRSPTSPTSPKGQNLVENKTIQRLMLAHRSKLRESVGTDEGDTTNDSTEHDSSSVDLTGKRGNRRSTVFGGAATPGLVQSVHSAGDINDVDDGDDDDDDYGGLEEFKQRLSRFCTIYLGFVLVVCSRSRRRRCCCLAERDVFSQHFFNPD